MRALRARLEIETNWFITIGDTSGWPTPDAFALRFTPNAGAPVPAASVSGDIVVTGIDAPIVVQ